MIELQTIQQRLAVPKGQNNDFGGYKYRSCEDILNALKPFLKETKTSVILTDHLQECGGWVFVVATARLVRENGTTVSETTGMARHADIKKGMDASQITGCASSYARKYSLCGLFCIDGGTQDMDALNRHDDTDEPPSGNRGNRSPGVTADSADFVKIKQARENAGLRPDQVIAICKEAPFCVDSPQQLLKVHVAALLSRINSIGLPE